MAEPAPSRGLVLRAGCCVVGAGPAGMMLGFLLARAGVDVIVLEKHADFFRDFRGDTIHPATTDLMAELGLLDEFLRLPHTEVSELRLGVDGVTYPLVDFSHLPTRCKFMAFMPQWDFLNFLAEHAAKYPTFRLMMRTEATELVREGDRVVGVRATAPGGETEIQAGLTVACDGRFSVARPLLAHLARRRRSASSTNWRDDLYAFGDRHTWILPVIGATTGFLVGLTSVGSGTLIIVGLLFLYPRWQSKELVGTDIFHAAILVSAASVAQLAAGNVNVSMAISLLIGSIPGVLLGSRLAIGFPEQLLRFSLATVLLISGAKML